MGGRVKAKKTVKKKIVKKKAVTDSKLILSHSLVPKMHILSDGDFKKVSSKYNVTKEDLPKLYITDPEAQSLKAKIGDVIEIVRDDTTGAYKTYRVVVLA